MGINEIYTTSFATVSKALLSGFRTDSEDFDRYAKEIIILCLHVCSWHYMPKSFHKY